MSVWITLPAALLSQPINTVYRVIYLEKTCSIDI